MPNSPRLDVPYIVSGQAQKELTHNDALNDLDSLAQISVITSTTNAPPGSPAEGDSYIIGPSPTGAWAGHAGKVASYYSGWRIKTPKEGWVAWVRDLDCLYIHTGSAWASARIYVPAGAMATPGLAVDGDADTGIYSSGANTLLITAGARNVAQFNTASSAVNYVTFTPSATGAAPSIAATGSDTNVDFTVTPKGTGVFRFGNSGSFIANGSIATVMSSLGPTGSHTTVQEWLQIKNSVGTVRYIPCF